GAGGSAAWLRVPGTRLGEAVRRRKRSGTSRPALAPPETTSQHALRPVRQWGDVEHRIRVQTGLGHVRSRGLGCAEREGFRAPDDVPGAATPGLPRYRDRGAHQRRRYGVLAEGSGGGDQRPGGYSAPAEDRERPG